MSAAAPLARATSARAVHHDFRDMWIRQLAGCFHQLKQRSCAQIFFTNLNPFNARSQIAGDRIEQRPWSERPPIGYIAANHIEFVHSALSLGLRTRASSMPK